MKVTWKALSRLQEGRSRAIVNSHETITGDFTRNPDLAFPSRQLSRGIAAAVGDGAAEFIDATRLATGLLGDAIATNLFLLGYAQNELPASFAIPAGIGDVLVGLAAPFVAVLSAPSTRAGRRIIIGWCVVGLADLVVAVTMGVLNAPGKFGLLAGEVTTAPLLELPLSLIPTFFVPLSILLHLIVLRLTLNTSSAPARLAPAASAI